MGDVDGKVTIALDVEPVDVNGTVKAISDTISKGVENGAQLAKRELANLENDILQNNRKVTERIAKGYVKAADAIKQINGKVTLVKPEIAETKTADVDTSKIETIKVTAEQTQSFLDTLAEDTAIKVTAAFEEITGKVADTDALFSQVSQNIVDCVAGAENFAHILNMMDFSSAESFLDYMESFSNEVLQSTLAPLQDLPISNTARLLPLKDMVSDSELFKRDLAEMTSGADTLRNHLNGIVEPVKQLPMVVSTLPSVVAQTTNQVSNAVKQLPMVIDTAKQLPALMSDLNANSTTALSTINRITTAFGSMSDVQLPSERFMVSAEQMQEFFTQFSNSAAESLKPAFDDALSAVIDVNSIASEINKQILEWVGSAENFANVINSMNLGKSGVASFAGGFGEKVYNNALKNMQNMNVKPEIVDEKEYNRYVKILEIANKLYEKRQQLAQLNEKQDNNLINPMATKGTKAYADTEAEIQNLQAEIQSLEAEFDKLSDKSDQTGDKMQGTFSLVGSVISRIFPSFGSSLNQVMGTIDTISGLFGDTAQSAENAGASMESMGASASGLASALGYVAAAIGGVIAGLIWGYNYSKKVEALGSQFISKLVSTIQNGFQKAISVVKQFGSAIASVLSKANSLLSKFGGGIKSFFTSLFKHNNKSALSFKKLFTFISKYGFGVRSTYMLFRKFRTMVTEGFKSMAQYADRFNKAMTNITSGWNQLKGQVSAILEPLITQFEPLITMIIDKLTQAALAVTKFMGAIMGFKKVLKAIKVIKDYASAVGSANKQLAGFDELNNLTSDSGSGADDNGNGWEWVDAEVPDWWERLKSEWEKENPDFSFLSRTIADKLSEVMENIPWENIFNKAYKGGFSFSTFLNGFFTDDGGDVSTRFFDNISSTIANGLNTVTYAVQGAIDGFKFSEFGKALGSGFVSLTNAIDWFTISDNIVNGVDGVLTTVSKFIGTVFGEGGTDFMLIESTIMSTIDGLITDVTKFLRTTDFDSVLNTASKLIRHGVTDLIDIAYAHIDDVDWQGLGQRLGAQLSTLFFDVDWAKLGDTIGQGLINALDFAKGFLQWADLSGIVDNVVTVISNINWSEVGTEFGAVLNALGEEFADIAASTYVSVEDNPLYKFFHSMFSEANITAILHNVIATVGNLSIDLVELLGGIISDIFDPENGIDFADLGSILGDAITQILANIREVLSSNKDNIIQGIQAFLDELDLQQIASDIVHIIKLVFEIAEKSGLVSEIGAFLMTIGSNLKTELFKMNFVKFFGSLGAKVNAGIESLKKTLTDKFGEAGESILRGIAAGVIGGLTSILFGPFVGLVAAIIGWFCDPLGIHSPSTVFEGFGVNLIEGLVNGITSMLSSISKVFTEITTRITTTAQEWWDAVTSKVTEIKDSVAEKWEEIKTNITEKWSEMKDIIFNKWEEIKTTITDSITNVKETLTTKWNEIKTIIQEKVDLIRDNLRNKWDEIKTNITNKFTEMKDTISNKLEDWKNNISDKLTNIKNLFIEKFTTIKDKVSEIVHNMWNVIKQPLNAILGGAEAVANGVINGINGAINALNKLSFTVPKWVPEIGGSTFGFNLGTLSNVSLPRLAQGAVIPPNKEFMAVLGDQKHGTNIETPLETMLEAFNMALDQNSSDEQIISLMQTQVQLLQAIANKRFGHTDKEIFDSVVKTENEQYKISGKHVLAG